MKPILYDITEFLQRPLRSGVQRVVYEVMAGWPGPAPLRPARVDADGRLVALAPDVLATVRAFFDAGPGESADAAPALQALAQSGTPLPPGELAGYDAIVNVEVFFDPARAAFYSDVARGPLGGRVFFLVHDLLPWLQPQWFARHTVSLTMHYPRTLRGVRHCGFNSEQTRQDFLTRLVRRQGPGGPVLPLGADGLGSAAPSFDPACRRFSVVGTLEPRKNHRAVVAAFEALWAEGVDVELVFAGRPGWLGAGEIEYLNGLRGSQPRFRWLEGASDPEVAAVIRSSRATIYPSWVEGYGLPPTESLMLGVPVIVSAQVPSTAMLPPGGQVRLAVPDARSVRRAVLAMLDEDYARSRHDEIRSLELPRWAELGRQVAEWVAGAN